ncbi:MAG: glycosyltransferase [Patescibacteria group bacterium]
MNQNKIYYLANARMPTERAHGIQLAKMCEAMIDAGADIELVLPRRATDKKSIREFYSLRRDIPVRKIWTLDIYGWGAIGYYIGSVSFMLSYALFFLIKKIRGERFIIYTIDMDQFSFALVPLLGAPYFVEIHDSKKYSYIYSLLFRNARGLIVINSLIKNEIVENFKLKNQEKILVFPNGIDINFFNIEISKEAARKKLNLSQDVKIALYGGQFYQWKGFEIFPKVAKLLNEKEKPIIAIVGADKHEVLAGLGMKDFPANLKFFGKRPYAEMPLWFVAADALIVLGTKKSDYSYLHTSPMKLFEYMAARRPIVAAQTPAIEDVVTQREVFFYEPDNADAMARIITQALENSAEADAKVDGAFAKTAVFSWEKRGKRVYDFVSQNI